jgi:hypothetical protein
MIVIAAIAFGVAVPRAYRTIMESNFDQIGVFMFTEASKSAVMTAWVLIASAAVSLRIIFSPSQFGRERFRKAGTLAIFMALLTWVWFQSSAALTQSWFRVHQERMTDTGTYALFIEPLLQTFQQAGLTVLASWITLGCLGKARPGTDWLDRSGCILGCTWIGFAVYSQFLVYFFPM